MNKKVFLIFPSEKKLFSYNVIIIQSTVVDVVILFFSLFPIFWTKKKRFKENLVIWTHTEAPIQITRGQKQPPSFIFKTFYCQKWSDPGQPPPPLLFVPVFGPTKCFPWGHHIAIELVQKFSRKSLKKMLNKKVCLLCRFSLVLTKLYCLFVSLKWIFNILFSYKLHYG